MRIAVPVKDGVFSPHFGRSDGFDLFVINRAGTGVTASERRSLVPGSDCHDFARCAADLGVEVVIAGGIGPGALDQLRQFGIMAVVGAHPADTRAIVADYLAGTLELSPNGCEHEDEEHHGQCTHTSN